MNSFSAETATDHTRPQHQYEYNEEENLLLTTKGWRVKLYRLNSDGSWDDCGTGRIAVFFTEQNASMLCMHAETHADDSEDAAPKVLLRVDVLVKDAYQRQGDNIITWCEPNFLPNLEARAGNSGAGNGNNAADSAETDGDNVGGVDLALSFQDNAGCLDVWNQISEIQRLNHQACLDFSNGGGAGDNACDGGAATPQNGDNNSTGSVVTDDEHAAEQGYLDYTNYATRQQERSAPLHGHAHAPSNFPQVTCPNLEQISNLILLPSNSHQFSQLVLCNNYQYLFDLLNIFEELEEAGDYNNLANLAVIVKSVLLLNEPGVVELICEGGIFEEGGEQDDGFSDKDVFTRVCAILEYDPDLRVKANHRLHLSRVKFRTVLKIENEALLLAIFKSYRATYLRDTLLRPTMDDNSISTLSSYIYFTHADVIREVTTTIGGTDDDGTVKEGFLSDDCYLYNVLVALAEDARMLLKNEFFIETDTKVKEVEFEKSSQIIQGGPFSQTVAPSDKSYASTIERRNVAVMFLRELFGIVRGSLQPAAREEFLDTLLQISLPFESSVSSDDAPYSILNTFSLLLRQLQGCHVQITSLLDILVGFFYHDSQLVRLYAIQNAKVSDSLIYALITTLHTTTDTAIHTPLLETLRTLLDTTDDHMFIQTWYDHYFSRLVNVDDKTSGTVLGQVCDIVAFCASAHCHACKFYLLEKNNELLCQLVTRGLKKYISRCVKLSALRLMRSIVATKDGFYYKHIISTNIFSSIFDCFRTNPVGDNLVSSAIVELCEFIRSETPSTLILLEHIIKKHLSDDANLEQMAQQYVGTFTLMRRKYEEHQQTKLDASGASSTSSVTTSSNKRSWGTSAKALEENRKFRLAGEEESYFMGDDDEDTGGAITETGLGALVQYHSDEENGVDTGRDSEERRNKKQKILSS